MEGPVCLIVNPHAGAGRAMRLLPGVEAALRGLGRTFRVEPTASMEHARELARAARDAGEIVAAMGGDGIIGAVAGELRDGRGLLAILPGGRGNDFARKLGIPFDPVGRLRAPDSGVERRIDLADANGTAFLGILSAGLDSDVNERANATRLPLGTNVYKYAALRALAVWKRAGWAVEIDGEQRGFTGYSVAVSNSGVFGGGMWLVPDASLDDGMLDVVRSPIRASCAICAGCNGCSRARISRTPRRTLLHGREITFSADRPFVAYADGDPVGALPLTVRVLPGTLRVVMPK